MLDISWGEMAVLAGVGLVLIGRKDLPIASRALGQQVGRIVGLLQGARLRADRFTADHQLKHLQNEFRSGLRELDAVKAELAGSMMGGGGGGLMGGGGMGMGGAGNLGAMVPSANRRQNTMGGMMNAAAAGVAAGVTQSSLSGPVGMSASSSSMGAEYLAAAQHAESSQGNNSPPIMDGGSAAAVLAPRSQSVAAVAEEEWEKRGIGFRSIAEGRGGIQSQQHGSIPGLEGPNSAPVGGSVGGAVILSNYLRQSLIYDQYERTVREQDDALRSRVDKVQKERSKEKDKVR